MTVDPVKLDIARQAVQKFEELRSSLQVEEGQFRQEYPEAHERLQSINHMRDEVTDSITYAKALVAEVGETIGEFVVQKKKTTPHYDESKFLQALVNLCIEGVPEWAVSRFMGVVNHLSEDNGLNPELIQRFVEDAAVGEAIRILAEVGVAASVSVDKTAANTFFPRNSDAQESFASAFDPGGVPMTPAVKVPKI